MFYVVCYTIFLPAPYRSPTQGRIVRNLRRPSGDKVAGGYDIILNKANPFQRLLISNISRRRREIRRYRQIAENVVMPQAVNRNEIERAIE